MDEIYAGIVYHDVKFHSFCELAKITPVIHVSGISKRFMVPGWRVGWSIVHDPSNIFKGGLADNIIKMSTRLCGPNSLIQSALPDFLPETSDLWHEEQNQKIAKAADLFYDGIMKASGLSPIMPNGAIYMMVWLFNFD